MGFSTPPSAEGITTKSCPYGVAETVDRVTKLIDDRGLKLFALIDHSGEAEHVGLPMPDTRLVLFGSPAAGTPIMLAAPLAALDLPLKILIWADSDGAVWVSYNSPCYLAHRFGLHDELVARIQAIESITDAIISPAGTR